MRLLPITAAIALVLALPSSAAETDKPAAPDIKTIHCAHLVDTDAGRLLGESTIVIEGARIKEVRPGKADVAGVKQAIDLPASTCLLSRVSIKTDTFCISPAFPKRLRPRSAWGLAWVTKS